MIEVFLGWLMIGCVGVIAGSPFLLFYRMRLIELRMQELEIHMVGVKHALENLDCGDDPDDPESNDEIPRQNIIAIGKLVA